jgi:hypothetical protein
MQEVQMANSQACSNDLAKECGIKGVPLLSHLSSVSFPGSFPYDFMHLIWENVVKNLMLLWMGDFKGMDQGTGNYKMSRECYARS